jgi:ribosome biogenesis SPOUT family RNA methylase Rps3
MLDQVLVENDRMEMIEPKSTSQGGVVQGGIVGREIPRDRGEEMTRETTTVVVQEETLKEWLLHGSQEQIL